MKSKPIRIFTLYDKDGNQYEISEFKTFSTTHAEDKSLDSKIFERSIYRLSDEREVLNTDDGFEILNPPNNIKLIDCK